MLYLKIINGEEGFCSILTSYHVYCSTHQFYDYIDYGRQDNTDLEKRVKCHTEKVHNSNQQLKLVVLIHKTLDE